MNKLAWILIIGVVVIAGVYFVFMKNNNISNEPAPISAEQQDIKTTVSPPQNTQIKIPPQTKKTPVKPTTNNTGGIPQPPKLPE